MNVNQVHISNWIQGFNKGDFYLLICLKKSLQVITKKCHRKNVTLRKQITKTQSVLEFHLLWVA